MSDEIIRPGGGIPLPIRGLDAMALATNVIDRVGEWVQLVRTETTKRADIAAWERTTVDEIRATRDVLITYLNRSFDERTENFRRLFDSLDAAIADRSEKVSEVLGAITALAMKGPFADLKDVHTAARALKDPDHEWEI
jgi:hypothetical protein